MCIQVRFSGGNLFNVTKMYSIWEDFLQGIIVQSRSDKMKLKLCDCGNFNMDFHILPLNYTSHIFLFAKDAPQTCSGAALILLNIDFCILVVTRVC